MVKQSFKAVWLHTLCSGPLESRSYFPPFFLIVNEEGFMQVATAPGCTTSQLVEILEEDSNNLCLVLLFLPGRAATVVYVPTLIFVDLCYWVFPLPPCVQRHISPSFQHPWQGSCKLLSPLLLHRKVSLLREEIGLDPWMCTCDFIGKQTCLMALLSFILKEILSLTPGLPCLGTLVSKRKEMVLFLRWTWWHMHN